MIDRNAIALGLRNGGNILYAANIVQQSGTASLSSLAISGTTSLGGTATIRWTSTQASGLNAGVSIQPVYNQTSGNATNAAIWINTTETHVGSGGQYFLLVQKGGVTKCYIDHNGNISTVATFVANSGSFAAEVIFNQDTFGNPGVVVNGNPAYYQDGLHDISEWYDGMGNLQTWIDSYGDLNSNYITFYAGISPDGSDWGASGTTANGDTVINGIITAIA